MARDLQAFLDSGTSFEGKISFTGAVRIDGHFQGEIRADGTLLVGETGLVEANLHVGSLVLEGTVVGEVTAKDRVKIGASGDLRGSLQTPVLEVAEGGRLSARVAMGEPGGGALVRASSSQEPAPGG